MAKNRFTPLSIRLSYQNLWATKMRAKDAQLSLMCNSLFKSIYLFSIIPVCWHYSLFIVQIHVWIWSLILLLNFALNVSIQVCKCVLLCSRHVLGRPLLMIEVELLKKRNWIDPTYYKVQGIENGIGLWTLFWATND